ncbi:MAG: imidazole glycerol phosphate synthase subunit HisH [Bacteroidetes bacterium]|jgi:glutamine amidotransferase|nr:imidazole glycerol phosphate synthase subunit HisH [Bacteroidota bacterium]
MISNGPLIGLIRYGSGNLRSLENALHRLNVPTVVSDDPAKLGSVEKLIFPGVGEARSAMERLTDAGLLSWLRSTTQPFLGICLGMQLLFDRSTERETDCLGVLPGTITRFSSGKVPHMGWNTVEPTGDDPLWSGLPPNAYFYFVHSYFAPLGDFTIGRTEYGQGFSSAVRHGSRWGVQFHPEKSGADGLKLLRNFVERC